MKYLLIIAPIIILGIFFLKPKTQSSSSPVPESQNVTVGTSTEIEKKSFSGEKGDSLKLENGQVNLATAGFEVNKVKFFNTTLADGKTVYYLVLKDKDGNFRAAANANEQCAAFGKGYRQVGENLECITCGKVYPVSDLAIEKPDCNPFPINPKLLVSNDKIIINSSELEKIAYLF